MNKLVEEKARALACKEQKKRRSLAVKLRAIAPLHAQPSVEASVEYKVTW